MGGPLKKTPVDFAVPLFAAHFPQVHAGKGLSPGWDVSAAQVGQHQGQGERRAGLLAQRERARGLKIMAIMARNCQYIKSRLGCNGFTQQWLKIGSIFFAMSRPCACWCCHLVGGCVLLHMLGMFELMFACEPGWVGL